MTPRRITACLCLPLALGLERAAWYALRSGLWFFLSSRLGLPIHQVGIASSVVAGAAAFTPLLGGLLCLVVPPRWVAVIGLALMVPGYALMLVADRLPPAVWLALPVLLIARGLFGPALFAAAAEVFLDPMESARDALFFLLYGASNAAAFLFTLTSGQLSLRYGLAVIFAVPVGLILLALPLAAVHALVGRPQEGEAARPWPRPEGLAVIAALGLLLSLTVELAMTRSRGAATSHPSWLYQVNPGMVMLTSPLFAALLAALALNRVRAHAGYPIGAGLALAALSALPVLLFHHEATAIAGAALGGLGEAVAAPIVLARLSGVPPRWSALCMAGWLLVSGVASLAVGAVPEGVAPWLLAPVALLALLAGLAVLALAPRFGRAFYP